MGLPKLILNSIGPRAELSQDYGHLLKETFGLPVHLLEQRYTTVTASHLLITTADASRKRQLQDIDKLAAQNILQLYLDAKGPYTKQ